MLSYAEYPFHSISMTQDEILKSILENLAKKNIEIIIETGTFNGLGSTTFVSNAFEKCNTLKTFYTLEVNPKSYAEALENLKDFPKVKCINGASLNLKEALKFVEEDEAINHHENYPDIFIDTLDNPVAFYAKELRGLLGENEPEQLTEPQPKRPFSLKRFLGLKPKITTPKINPIPEDLLKDLITKHKSNNLLIVLDSAGGVGYMEFQKVMSLLKNTSFYLMLDDTHHLKHFRSLRDIQANPNFNILGVSKQHGWCVAKYL